MGGAVGRPQWICAYGCATIISNKGGLPETFNSDLILKKIDTNVLYNLLKN